MIGKRSSTGRKINRGGRPTSAATRINPRLDLPLRVAALPPVQENCNDKCVLDRNTDQDLEAQTLPVDTVGLLEGLTTTRAIRRYTRDAVPPEALRAMLFAATRAPSGSNRQPFRFIVLADGPNARKAKRLIADSAQGLWGRKRESDGYTRGSGELAHSPKARMDATMQNFVEHFEDVPVLILPCLVRYRDPTPMEGASVYPACQNLLLAARALGYGGAFTGWHHAVEAELRQLLAIPDGVFLAGTITIGKPAGHHGPVRRRPICELLTPNAGNSHPVGRSIRPGPNTPQRVHRRSRRWMPMGGWRRDTPPSPERRTSSALVVMSESGPLRIHYPRAIDISRATGGN